MGENFHTNDKLRYLQCRKSKDTYPDSQIHSWLQISNYNTTTNFKRKQSGNQAIHRRGDQTANKYVKSSSRSAVIRGIQIQTRGPLTPSREAKLEMWGGGNAALLRGESCNHLSGQLAGSI